MIPMPRITVLICGGRNYSSSDAWNWLEKHLADEVGDRLRLSRFLIATVIHGGARGADEGAASWGESEHCKVVAYPADWKKHGKAAGPIRNRKMATEGKPDVLVAFPGGAGTANMIRTAEECGIPVIRVEDRPPCPPICAGG